VFEHVCFVVAGFLFWWPVIQPWPSVAKWPRWSIILYLFAATIPCDILSAFLVFCDRVVYPAYLSQPPQPLGISALQDQQCAAALMWTCVTIVYLVPAAILTVGLLAPRSYREDELVPSELQRIATRQSEPHSVEVG
jgi:cytochrome c oxidase assembly factor CtaG